MVLLAGKEGWGKRSSVVYYVQVVANGSLLGHTHIWLSSFVALFVGKRKRKDDKTTSLSS